jgi:HD domain
MLKYPDTRYDPVWVAFDKYWRVRKNDVHIPLSYAFVRQLLEAYPDADEDVCTLALMLHDIGWHSIDGPDLIEKAFGGKNFMRSDARYFHEAEGCRISTELLQALGWSAEVIAQVCEIIDGHDTRAAPHHLNDRIVRDADKLWRFGVTGVSVACDWFKMTPRQYADKLEAVNLAELETDVGRALAAQELALARRTLKLHLI